MIIDNPSPISKNSKDPSVTRLLEDLQDNILKSNSKPNLKLLFMRSTGSPAEVM